MDNSSNPGTSSSANAATYGTEEREESSPTTVLGFQKSVNKRLNAMTDRQDSIQALSMWMIHHKTDCQKIAGCWLAAMKRGRA